jgi:transcription elongation factor GreA
LQSEERKQRRRRGILHKAEFRQNDWMKKGRSARKEGKDDMAEKKHILTYAGLKQYEEELEDLKVNRRKEISQKIKEAREQGDLSENAEYDAAKDEQRDIEARIEELEKLLKNAEVVVEDEVDANKVNIGCKVKVYDVEYDEEMEFSLVGSTEANSLQNKISNESPVGRALIGKQVGDTVSVDTLDGTIEYKVLSIERNN